MSENRSLFEQLHIYGQSDYYPYHMPGHKRRQLGQIPEQTLEIDITEIDGFDNLHQPEGVLQEIQNRAAKLYSAEESFFLVNGSTCGILSAVSAALPEGGHLLMARGCHKSAYHAVYLRRLHVTYLYAEQVEGFDFQEAVTARQVEEALDKEPDIGAVLIVSPTYEGRVTDIAEIACVVHKKGIPLIVDEAHGAHLGFAPGFAKNSCTQGADLVIHSVHKTLPAMTQTALLHVNGALIDRQRLRRFLHIYQTSSPSYVLMASINDAMQILEQQGAQLFNEFRQRYCRMCEQLSSCRVLQFVSLAEIDTGRQDIGKLVISTSRTEFSGQWIYDMLRDKYHLQCEMAAGSYCLAMFTMADGEEAYERMTRALMELDEYLTRQVQIGERQNSFCQEEVKAAYSLTEAWDKPWELTEMSQAIGHPVAEFINLYPPGVPLMVPGEVFTQTLYEQLLDYQNKKLKIQGITERNGILLLPVIK